MIVSATARLARQLQHEYGARQLAEGRTAWTTPAILPWKAFVRRLWEEQSDTPMLTPVQEQALWQSIIEASPESAQLIQPEAAARLATQAWELVYEWQIPLAGRKHAGAWQVTPETSAFYGWAQQFEFHTSWLGRSGASFGLRGTAEALTLVGFDELTPFQKQILAQFQVTHQPAPAHAAIAHLAAFADGAAEEEAAAQWCRERVGARIGVIVQDLEQRRHRFERAFRLAVPGAFHIALGPPLATRPMIAAALRILELGIGSTAWETMSSLLLSPWVGGYERERSQRAACEVLLRRARPFTHPPAFARALRHTETQRLDWPEEQKPGAWGRAFAAVLEAFGWPGDRPLSSLEHQTLEAWRAALSAFASLDLVAAPVTAYRAFAMLRRLATERRFEVESTGEPIQIMGLGESAGIEFDHLWIAGMTDEVWPARPAPNPFIPLALQRQYNVPHSSPARELAYASRVSQRLLRAAPEIVVSYAKADTERELAPSPLFSARPAWSPASLAAAVHVPVELETVADATGPAIAPGATTLGGTRALELQAKCPFRAFAEMRLGARELETPEAGLDPRERGGFLHTALELFWKRIPSSAALRALTPESASAVLAECIDESLARHATSDSELTGKLLALERVRLLELLGSWLELERERTIEFTVEEPEQARTVEIGGLTVQVRLDRLDKLANGAYALIDYKSRAPKLGDWDGERPESPQVPIYAVTAREPLGALAFGQVRTAENLFKGYSILEGALPGVRAVEPSVLNDRIAEWRRVLEALGENFRAGRAEVDPKDRFKTCEICHLAALCRVEEK